jgi:hypothetical protein
MARILIEVDAELWKAAREALQKFRDADCNDAPDARLSDLEAQDAATLTLGAAAAPLLADAHVAPLLAGGHIALALDYARELVAEGGADDLVREIEATETKPFGFSLHLLADAAEQAGGERDGRERYYRARTAAAAARLAAYLQSLAQHEEASRG